MAFNYSSFVGETKSFRAAMKTVLYIEQKLAVELFQTINKDELSQDFFY